MRHEFKVGKRIIQLVKGDITSIETDVIVNAANSSLMGGGGVDGAIHRSGGPKILEECKKIRASDWPQGLPTGKAVITGAGNLKARYIIHTVGPVWRGGNYGEPELLAKAYKNSLKLASDKGLNSIAFPSISTGAYRYPIEDAAHITIRALEDFLKNDNNIEKVVLVLFSENAFKVFLNKANELL